MTTCTSELLLEKAHALPRVVRPIVEYAERLQPDAIIVCDRDARPLGYAFEMAVHELGLSELTEGKVWYRRISKKLGRNAISEHCQDVYDSVEGVDRPKLLVIDDHISSRATTASLFRAATTHAGLDRASISWTTLTGKGTALNLIPYASPVNEAPWRDRPEILGIDYSGTELQVRPTDESIAFYEAIRQGAAEL
jgi:hypothetical protein